MEIKLCGMTCAADAVRALELGADYVGVVLAPGPRGTSAAVAAQIVSATDPDRVVLVFRDAALEFILAALDVTGASWLQLHGAEDPRFAIELRRRFPNIGLIKAWEVAVGDSASSVMAGIGEWAGAASRRVLLDQPKDGGRTSREAFTSVCASWSSTLPPLWRAGGLTPDNLADLAQEGRYAGVDVARGVERSPGAKDADLMRRFIDAARSA